MSLRTKDRLLPFYCCFFMLASSFCACTPGLPPSTSGRGIAVQTSVSFRCTGTEPFWSLDISPAGMVFQTPGSSPVTYPFNASKSNGGTLEFNSSVNTETGKSTLKVILTPGDCSDGMSDIRYPYFAEVIRDGQQLRGCAKEMP